MDHCTHCEGIDNHFSREKAREKLEEYHVNGPQKTTRILVSALKSQGVRDKTLLDIGGGIGAIQHELFKSGISYATNLEASSAYMQICQEEANRQGHGNKIHHIHGNIVDMENLPMSDIVTLERVLCCYPDMQCIINMACKKARYLLGLVYPRNTWWVKIGMIFTANLMYRFRRNPFRLFLHDTDQVNALVIANQFKQVFYKKTGAWQVFVYAKQS